MLVPADLDGLRRVQPELFHVTLAFIGWIEDARTADVTEAVRTAVAGQPAFEVALDEVGRFPPTGRPRVLWAGASSAVPRIEALATLVRGGLQRAEIPFDAKPARPHVTLARVREDAGGDVARAVAAAARTSRVPAGLGFTAASVHVMQSTLTPQGPRYSSRAEVPLEEARTWG